MIEIMIQVTFDDDPFESAIEEATWQQPAGQPEPSDEADLWESEEGTDALDELDSEESKPEEKAPETTTPEQPAEEKTAPEWEATAEEKPAEEAAKDAEETKLEKAAEGETYDAKAIGELEKVLGLIGDDVKKDNEEIKQDVKQSSMTEEEKTALLTKLDEGQAKLEEKDEIIRELQLRYKTLEDNHSERIVENENLKLDTLQNKKVVDKFESDPEVQQFISLKIKADTWDETSKARLENFYKEQLSGMWYDIEKLVQQKKMEEKKAMSKSSAPSGSDNYNTEFESGDALESLDTWE